MAKRIRATAQTRGGILSTALKLFNESGTAAISTNHIAQAFDISPGNLYYHYRNKEAIIRDLFDQLYLEWDRIYAFPEDRAPTLDDLRRMLGATFATHWAYRFIFRELVALLRRDADLQERWFAVRRRGFEGFGFLLQAFVEAGVLKPPADSAELTRLTETIWLISEFWLPTLEVSGQPVNPDTFAHGVELMSQALAPYIVAPPQRKSRRPRRG